MKNIIIILLFLPLVSVADNKGDTLVSKQSLIEIQQKIIELEKEVSNGKIDLKTAKSNLTISEQYSKSADNLINNWTKLFSLAISLAGIIGFISLLKYIKLRLSQIMHQKEETINELFLKHEVEKGLISNSKILIINKKGTKLNEYLENVLKKFSKKIVVEDVPDLLIHEFKNNFKDFDLVLFDNTNTLNQTNNWDFRQNKPNEKDTEDIKIAIQKQNEVNMKLKGELVKIAENVCNFNTAFLFFGNNDDKFAEKLPKHAHLINFSNSPSTAYSNIINLLNFRMLLKESI